MEGLGSSDEPLDAAMRAADALFARPLSELTNETVSPGSAAPLSNTNGELKTSGRILQALDEAPDPVILALEAEHAPKRRGRKPGSKNKPKTAASVTAEPTAPKVMHVAASQPIRRIRPIEDVAIAEDPAPTPRRANRPIWRHDRLKPWESWKRRLPRVCW